MNTTTEGINLREFKFPDVTGADMVFPTFDTIPELLDEAERRGFDGSDNPYHRMVSTLFFEGGKVKPKADVPEDYYKRVWAYVRAFMGSFAPKHEDKTAICALLLSEIVEPKLQAKK
jgi:hypothetical protein